MRKAFDGVIPATLTEVDTPQLSAAFADAIRRFVRFAAEHPELNQIMVHEGTAASDRLTWMTETHVKPVFDAIRPAWQMLRDVGVAAPIDSEILYYVLIGAASLPYVNAPEVRLLTGQDPEEPRVDRRSRQRIGRHPAAGISRRLTSGVSSAAARGSALLARANRYYVC